jgi:hypothetical protein
MAMIDWTATVSILVAGDGAVGVRRWMAQDPE